MAFFKVKSKGKTAEPAVTLKGHLQQTGIASHGTIFVCENPTKAEIHPIRLLREALQIPITKATVKKPVS